MRQFDQELGIALEMMDTRRVRTRESRHRFYAFPIRYRHELTFSWTIFAKQLHP